MAENSNLINVEIEERQLEKLLDGMVVNQPIRPRKVSNVKVSVKVELPEVLRITIESMNSAGYDIRRYKASGS